MYRLHDAMLDGLRPFGKAGPLVTGVPLNGHAEIAAAGGAAREAAMRVLTKGGSNEGEDGGKGPHACMTMLRRDCRACESGRPDWRVLFGCRHEAGGETGHCHWGRHWLPQGGHGHALSLCCCLSPRAQGPRALQRHARDQW